MHGVALGGALAAILADVQYSNFKSAVSAELGPERAHVLSEVWHALREVTELERSNDRERRRSR